MELLTGCIWPMLALAINSSVQMWWLNQSQALAEPQVLLRLLPTQQLACLPRHRWLISQQRMFLQHQHACTGDDSKHLNASSHEARLLATFTSAVCLDVGCVTSLLLMTGSGCICSEPRRFTRAGGRAVRGLTNWVCNQHTLLTALLSLTLPLGGMQRS